MKINRFPITRHQSVGGPSTRHPFDVPRAGALYPFDRPLECDHLQDRARHPFDLPMECDHCLDKTFSGAFWSLIKFQIV